MHIHKDSAEHFCMRHSKVIILLLIVVLVMVMTHDYTKERPRVKTENVGRIQNEMFSAKPSQVDTKRLLLLPPIK